MFLTYSGGKGPHESNVGPMLVDPCLAGVQ